MKPFIQYEVEIEMKNWISIVLLLKIGEIYEYKELEYYGKIDINDKQI